MPRRRRAWPAWKYMSPASVLGRAAPSRWTYWMNPAAIPAPAQRMSFVSVNPHARARIRAGLGTFAYDHPVFNAGGHCSADANRRIFKGRGAGSGSRGMDGLRLHEDGLSSALEVAQALACRVLAGARIEHVADNCRLHPGTGQPLAEGG